jgi:hypothetical protein
LRRDLHRADVVLCVFDSRTAPAAYQQVLLEHRPVELMYVAERYLTTTVARRILARLIDIYDMYIQIPISSNLSTGRGLGHHVRQANSRFYRKQGASEFNELE